ncbi:MAG: hypothetical protein KAJ91_04755 [Candidatus Aenigmarchaeota archaeon]|nr:hypothetical protein [Candidatus Aenigmarchaeota archaeon]
MELSFCAKCGAKLEEENKGSYCTKCSAEGKYRLYRDAFRAKRTVYVLS